MNKFLPKITPFLAPANIAEIESAQQKSYPARKLPEIGEIRIPAIAEINHTLYAFFDVRPKPKGSLNGNEFNGKTLASDLPNPNQIYYCPLTAPLHSQPLHTLCPQMPQISSDTAIAIDPFSGEIHIAFASIPENSQTGYFDSRYDGEHLLPGLLFGTDLNTLTYRPLTELYEILPAPDGEPLHPDAIFATSGSSITHNGAALLPYIARKGKLLSVMSYIFVQVRSQLFPIQSPHQIHSWTKVHSQKLMEKSGSIRVYKDS
ncbi:hypothetical protein [Arcanobacterium hippocoleae]|uniref:hypothetical protein n=1 Tax=Arcanobacterium hippocoleae TaxID=149017 RepID=UPI003342CF7A